MIYFKSQFYQALLVFQLLQHVVGGSGCCRRTPFDCIQRWINRTRKNRMATETRGKRQTTGEKYENQNGKPKSYAWIYKIYLQMNGLAWMWRAERFECVVRNGNDVFFIFSDLPASNSVEPMKPKGIFWCAHTKRISIDWSVIVCVEWCEHREPYSCTTACTPTVLCAKKHSRIVI